MTTGRPWTTEARPGELRKLIEETFTEHEIKGCMVNNKWDLEKVRAICGEKGLANRAEAIHEYLSRTYKKTQRVVIAIFAFYLAAMINAWAYVLTQTVIGGTAYDGKQENGRYYLGAKRRYTPVSHGVWMYSRIHGISVAASVPVSAALLVALFIYSEQARLTPKRKRILRGGFIRSVIRIVTAVIAISLLIAIWIYVTQRGK